MPSSPAASRLRHRTTTGKHQPVTSPTASTSTTTDDGSSSQNSPSTKSTARAIIATTASEWLLILTLIFGGCCSNAFTLELATRQLPSSGTLITFAQFFVTTLSSLPYFIVCGGSFPWIRLKKRKVPLYRWIVQVGFYLSTSLLNNIAFGYNVPMPVHIVFRSGGLVINMILGWLVQGRRYTALQVSNVILVTLGVVSSTLYSSHSSSSSSSSSSSKGAEMLEEGREGGEYATGVLLLFSALVLTGFMGLWQEKTFKLYGNQNWRESMFYSHLLSLPMFLLRPRNLIKDIGDANDTTPWWFGFGPPTHTAGKCFPAIKWIDNIVALLSPPSLASSRQIPKDTTAMRIFNLSSLLPPQFKPSLPSIGLWIPSFYPPLLLNVATQLLCINGVNRLTSKVSSLSVTLVLVVRKAVSLIISVMLVQRSSGSVGLWSGAAAVLIGTIGYSLAKPSSPSPPTKVKVKAKADAQDGSRKKA